MIELKQRSKKEYTSPTVIKVIGIGGGGSNVVNRMYLTRRNSFIEHIVINTDLQVLNQSPVEKKIQIGKKLTKGLGAGSNPEIGQRAAEEDRELIKEVIGNADMVFISAGMGGGTGTGASPIVAEIAKELNALTIAFVTKPFLFEGQTRLKIAEKGLKFLEEKVDSLITVPNQKLLDVVNEKTSLHEAFRIVDEVLQKGIEGISELITTPGLINLDFADIKTVMSQKGRALLGVGEASGENKAKEAAERAITSPLLEDVSIDGAKGVLINVKGGEDIKLCEINEAVTLITQKACKDATIIFGAIIDETLQDRMKITVIATGFQKTQPPTPSPVLHHKEIFDTKEEEPALWRKKEKREFYI